ncbi:MAG: KH domain-containing protein, partial [Minisyncoccia bacterium]
VNQADMGIIIGREGNTAKAIRTLLRVVGMKNNARVNLKINEPAGGVREVKTNATKSLDDAMNDLKL